MKTGEKIGLAAVIVALTSMLGGTIAFISTISLEDFEFHIKINYVLMTFLALTVGILYFISFTSKETKKEGESK